MGQGVPGKDSKAVVGSLRRLAGEGELLDVRVCLLHQENVEVVPRPCHWLSISEDTSNLEQ